MNFFLFRNLHDNLIFKNLSCLVFEESGRILGTIDMINKRYISLNGITQIILINYNTLNLTDKTFDNINVSSLKIDINKFLEKYPYLARNYSLDNYKQFYKNILNKYTFLPLSENLINISLFDSNIYIGALPKNTDQYNNFISTYKVVSIINMSEEPYNINEIDVFTYKINETINEKDKLIESADKLNELVLKNKKIFLHCLLGRNRSASVLLLYLIKYKKRNIFDAYFDIYSKRNICISKELGSHIYEMCPDEQKDCALFRICADTINCDDKGTYYLFNTFGLDFPNLEKNKNKLLENNYIFSEE